MRMNSLSAALLAAGVTVVGTAYSGTTNAQGYYFMNNVPAGTVKSRLARAREGLRAQLRDV